MITTYEEKVTVNDIPFLMRAALIVWSGVLMIGVMLGFSAAFMGNANFDTWGWAINPWVLTPFVVLTSAVQIAIHEGLHGLFFKVYGKFVQFGFKAWTKVGPVFYATSAGNMFTRFQYMQISLGPQIFTALCFAVVIVFHLPAIFWMVILTMGAQNLGGGIFDMYAAYRVLKLPRGAMIEDVKDGWKVYLYPAIKGASYDAE